jgi:hypothetical protein
MIASFLGLQTVAGLKLLSPPTWIPSLAPLRVAPNPTLWPFLAYDMYTRAFPAGRVIARPELIGVDVDQVRHRLTPESLGLTFREFRDDWLNPLRGGAADKASQLADRLAAQGGPRLVLLQCEDVPAIVSDDGVRDGERRVGRSYPIAEARP